MKNEVECPVDFVTINENKARLISFFVLILSITFLFTHLWVIPAFLVADFLARIKNWGKYSLLGILGDAVIKQVKIKYKPTDRAPKRFAAGVGLLFAAGILISTLLDLTVIAFALTSVLACFAILEAFVGFCAGCYVYAFLKKMRSRLKIKELI